MMTCEFCHGEVVSGSLNCAHCGRAISAGSRTPLLARANGQAERRGDLPLAPGGSFARQPSAFVVRLSNGREYRLSGQSVYLIGRLDDSPARPDGQGPHRPPDVDLAPFHGRDSGVSRTHIRIHVRPDGVFVEDMDSLNETIHNGFRLKSNQLYPLRDRDEFILGRIALRVLFEYS